MEGAVTVVAAATTAVRAGITAATTADMAATTGDMVATTAAMAATTGVTVEGITPIIIIRITEGPIMAMGTTVPSTSTFTTRTRIGTDREMAVGKTGTVDTTIRRMDRTLHPRSRPSPEITTRFRQKIATKVELC